jgi:hypothetical protein
MMLEDLYSHLVPTFASCTQKDLKTAVKILAMSLNYPDPKSCPWEACQQIITIRTTPQGRRVIRFAPTFETFLSTQGKGAHTIRNVKNNLSRLFLSAEGKGLVHLVPAVLTPHFNSKRRPPRPGSEGCGADGSHLLYQQWPESLKEEFAAFTTWATDPLVPNRDARWRKRLSTIAFYQPILCGYFGFLHHIKNIHDIRFNHLFDLSLIHAYVHWHVNDKMKRPTRTVHHFIRFLKMVTRQYQPQPDLRQALKQIEQTLPPPVPIYQKKDAWVPLRRIREIGQSLWPHKLPTDVIHGDGSRYALRAGLSLMLQLWTYIPYRSRNMSEMLLETNLYKHDGAWRIRFSGEQLKVAKRRGQQNIFDLPFPQPLIPTLESYLATWRPVLTRLMSFPSDHVFLSSVGHPLTGQNIQDLVQYHVYRYTGKYFNPHAIRTIWATEYIKATGGDFFTVAIMLNDTLETVIKNYIHLLDENVAEKAYRWVDNQRS